MVGTKQGITYFSDCKNISSITNPIIDNNVYMRTSGFLSANWKQEDIKFDTIGYGLYRDLSTKGTIWCNDASKLFTVGYSPDDPYLNSSSSSSSNYSTSGTINQGYIGITLSFPYAITNGVHELISDNKYFIFGTNAGIYDIKSPGFSLFLTKNGFEYTMMTSAGKFTMIDSYSTFAANEDIFIEFFWDKDHVYEVYDDCNVIVKVNGVAVIGGNAPIHGDSLVGYKFYCLDTPVLSSTLKCTIKNLICYNTVPEYVDNLEYSSSSSSTSSSSVTSQESFSQEIDSYLCNIYLNTSGGDAGYYKTFDVSSVDEFVLKVINFTTYTIKDQLIIYADGVIVIDSGCIATTSYSKSVTILATVNTVSVKVIPNCQGTTGTAWTLRIECE